MTEIVIPEERIRAPSWGITVSREAVKTAVIVANAVVSVGLVSWGLTGMILTNPGLGIEYQWSALSWILGLITLWFIPLEICLIKTRR